MMHARELKKQVGFSLLEMLVAMILGMIVVSGTIALYVSTIRSSADTVKSARLNYDLDSLMQLMVNDIRRAGYWGGAIVDSVATDNPFTATAANILISNKTGEAANTCILYTYDADGDSTLDLNEYAGFRLNGDGIDMRLASTAGVNTCNAGTWSPIVDTNKVTITAATPPPLDFDANYKCLNVSQGVAYDLSCADVIAADATDLVAGETAVESRQIDITLSGEVKDDDVVKKSLTGIVKVRNDRIFIQ